MKRLGAASMPICVTVLHGSLDWMLHDRAKALTSDHLFNVFADNTAPGTAIVDFPYAHSSLIRSIIKDGNCRTSQKILGLPIIPLAQSSAARRAEELKRLLYFGRFRPIKGFDLFVDSLLELCRETPEILAQLDEVVLLGHEAIPGAADRVRDKLLPTGLSVVHIGNFDSQQAQNYLAAHVADALVVVPSAFENLPYAVLEASLITGLNLICPNSGGTPEIFSGRGDAQLFDPTPGGLAAKIRERLRRPLRPVNSPNTILPLITTSGLDFTIASAVRRAPKPLLR